MVGGDFLIAHLHLFAFWFALTAVPSAPQSSVKFFIKPLPADSEIGETISLTLSNSSSDFLQYRGGLKAPFFKMSYISNGADCQDVIVPKNDIENLTYLRPHQFIETTIKLPAEATFYKFGFSYTSLSWRGKLAWDILEMRREIPFDRRPVVGFLLQQDEKKRSKNEWSEESSALWQHR